jgi:flagellar hook assembly protein FlgD
VDGQSVAWLTSAGDLQVAAIDVPLPQPRGLGDPIAPTTYAAGGSDTWSTSIPYSMPLTSCQVTISQGNTKVRTLDCDATQSARGVAAVSWDGRDQNGHVVADGSYTWTVTAAGSAGPALNAAGDAAPVTGTITAS